MVIMMRKNETEQISYVIDKISKEKSTEYAKPFTCKYYAECPALGNIGKGLKDGRELEVPAIVAMYTKLSGCLDKEKCKGCGVYKLKEGDKTHAEKQKEWIEDGRKFPDLKD